MSWAPNPPNFYKQFTSENLSKLEELQKAHHDHENGISANNNALLDLPPELRYLVPPSPPSDQTYRLFGIPRTTRDYLATLSDQGIQQLYPDPPTNDASSDWTLDREFYLKKLTRSIMLSFLELVGMLAENPREASRKEEEIKTMYLNALHLVNEYRPHQARESLILRMQDEVEKGRKEIADVAALKSRVEALVKDHDVLMEGSGMANGYVNGHINGTDEREEEEEEPSDADMQKAIWDVLNREFPREDAGA